MNKAIMFLVFWCLGSSLIWVQTNGQFLWSSFAKNPFMLSLVFGTLISYIMIMATKYGFSVLNGSLWSIKFVGFAIGMIVNALLNFYLMNEGLTMKTFICIILSLIIITIQFWKQKKKITGVIVYTGYMKRLNKKEIKLKRKKYLK